MMQEIQSLLDAAVECSYFIRPLDPGLTYHELQEIASRAGYLAGETSDAIAGLQLVYNSSKRALLGRHALNRWKFLFLEEPDYRNFDAFDLVFNELNQRIREHGYAQAQIARDTLAERAIAHGIAENDIQLAITYLLCSEGIVTKDNLIRFPGTAGTTHQLPSQSLRQMGNQLHKKPERAKAYPMVQDIIDRRSDGRLLSVEPLDAFADQLDKLGYSPFRLWWKQTVTEMRLGDSVQSPTSVAVLAAALVEGSLTFVVKHARSLSLPVFKSSDFDSSPRSWKIDDLVNSASTGGSEAILDPSSKALAVTLIRIRQRIHAGRMLTDFPQGVPDLKSDETRQARATAEQVVRRILDWLEKHPPLA